METDLRDEKIGYKIREAQLQKVPYMLIVGEKEMEAGAVSVRARKSGDLGPMSLAQFQSRLASDVESRSCADV